MRSVFLLFIIILWTSCSTSVRPISYGKDACEHCRMTIMDKKFGAELITKKGKIFVFDSDECLAQYVIKNPEQEKDMAAIWVADYENAGELVELSKAFFVKSAYIISPMGEGLASFSNEPTAQKIATEFKGKILSWAELKATVKPE